MKTSFREWVSDPVKVFNTLSVFMAGVVLGLLFGGYLG
jgi:chloramphenicol 3-O-phosphotransferase